MDKPAVLHMFTPAPQMSPFDLNMAVDAGFQHIFTHTGVTLEQVAALTQDAIFSRGPKGVKRTALFIGGREVGLAADMLDAARAAMVPPFAVSVLADPSGAFTTAAAMVALVERELRRKFSASLSGQQVLIMGGTGPVGAAAAVLVANAGGAVKVASHSSAERARKTAQALNARYATRIDAAEAGSAQQKAALLDQANVVLATAKAGVRVLSRDELTAARRLLVAADLNAVPPEGIEGLGASDDGKALPAGSGQAVGLGALAIGQIKYQLERTLLEQLLASVSPTYLDFRQAFEQARAQCAT